MRRYLLSIMRKALSRVARAGRTSPVRRSLWAGAPILNMAVNARAERLLGVQADSLVYGTYFITDEFSYNLSLWMRVPVVKRLLPYLVLLWACARYQRFHFFFDGGLLPTREYFAFDPDELRLLHELGKETYLWTYGADVRTRGKTEALGRYHCCMECPRPGGACICDDARGDENVALCARWANGLFAMGDMIEYTPGSRNDLFFWPVDLGADGGRKYAPQYPAADTDAPVRIVHAPNHRHYKGTRFLLEAVERLKGEGVAIELVLVERVPNVEALKIYRTADVVFDQCIIGFHGYFAIEAMAMGKPVMCYIRKPEQYLLHPRECPIVNTHVDTLAEDIRGLAADRARLREIGRAGRRYVEKHYTLEAFAGRLGRAYRDLGAWTS